MCRVVDPDDRCRRGGAGQGHPAAGSCPVRVAAHDAVLAGTGPARLLDMAEGRSIAWLAQRPQGVGRWGRGGHDERIHRVQDRRQRGTPNRDGSDGTAPCRPPCPGHPGPMPAPRPTELHRLDNYRLRMLLIAADFTPNDEEPIKPSKSQCKPSCGMLLLCAFLLPK